MSHLRLLLGVSLIVCLAPAAQAATDVERLTALLKRAKSSRAPGGVAFLVEFRHEGNLDLDAAEIAAAVKAARLSKTSDLAQTAAAIDRIQKRGDRITITREQEEAVDLGQGWMRLKPTATFRISDGQIADLNRGTRERLGLARGTYVRLHEVKGVKVGLTRNLTVGLSEFYYVEDKGRPKLAGRAGVGLAKFWKTVWLSGPTTTARAGLAGNVRG